MTTGIYVGKGKKKNRLNLGDRVLVTFINGDCVTGEFRGITPPITETTGPLFSVKTGDQQIYWVQSNVAKVKKI